MLVFIILLLTLNLVCAGFIMYFITHLLKEMDELHTKCTSIRLHLVLKDKNKGILYDRDERELIQSNQ